jgi:hypothetical protein
MIPGLLSKPWYCATSRIKFLRSLKDEQCFQICEVLVNFRGYDSPKRINLEFISFTEVMNKFGSP